MLTMDSIWMPYRMVYGTINSCEEQTELMLSFIQKVCKHKPLELLSISQFFNIDNYY